MTELDLALSPPRSWRDHALAILVALLVATVLGALCLGAIVVSPMQVLRALYAALFSGASVLPTQEHAVLIGIRMPRVLLGAFLGAALGGSGAAMQGVFRNPLVEPGLCGVSAGGALGAVFAIFMGIKLHGLVPASLTPYLLPIASFLGAMIATFAVQELARQGDRTPVTGLLLAGIGINAVAMALIGVMTHLSNDSQLRTITFWNLGSLGSTTWTSVWTTLPVLLVPIFLLPAKAASLDVMLLGETEAMHLGVHVERTRRQVLVLAALGVGAAVAVAGVVGFVGLVAPHLVRITLGPGHRTVIPGASLLGAVLVIAADIVARMAVLPAELPLGVVTALVGGPFLLGLLRKEQGGIA